MTQRRVWLESPAFIRVVHMIASRWTALILLGLGYSLALSHGGLEPPVLGVLLILCLAAFAVRSTHPAALRGAGHAVFIATGLGLALHWLPGFDNAPLMAMNRSSPQAFPFTTYWNLDKPLIGFWILLACPWIWQPVDARRTLKVALWAALAITGLCLLLACVTGVTTWAPKWPPYSLLWLLNNLLLVCLTEELLFRGYLQGALQRALQSCTRRWPSAVVFTRPGSAAALLPIVGVAVLFGLTHVGGGWAWTILAMLAGIGYGIAWRYGGLWAAVSAHFCLNLVHFTLFAYPMLER